MQQKYCTFDIKQLSINHESDFVKFNIINVEYNKLLVFSKLKIELKALLQIIMNQFHNNISYYILSSNKDIFV